jgi:hypothetical protein
MPRKTHRVGRKKKNTTHKKRKYVIRKYKFLRGGLGENDYTKIGINDKFSFGNPDNLEYEKIEEFKKYVFGSEEHAQKWEEILRLCSEKGIPFYILTSGNKLGIIRTLQLLELADYVTEVLCNNSSKRSNPPIENRTFDRMNKYQIIQFILADRCDQPEYTGIFIDNDERHMVNNELCRNVQFIHANGVNIQKNEDYEPTSFMTYVSGLYKDPTLTYFFASKPAGLGLTQEMYFVDKTNLVNTRILDTIIDRLNRENINIIFADFDGTMSPWGGALTFHLPAFSVDFNRHFGVVRSPL